MAIPFYSMDINFSEIRSIIKNVISGKAFKGISIKEYEDLICSTFGTKYVNIFPSERSGLFFLMDVLFKHGDEIITSIYTFPLFIRLMHEKGIVPVFIDVEEDSALINADLIEEKITQKTKGILVTHLFGNPCKMDKITEIANKYNIYLIEDCAHAFGSKYKNRLLGTFGTAALFSTSPMKVPTTAGGGFIITSSNELHSKLNNALHSNKQHRYDFIKFIKFSILFFIYYFNSFPWVFSIFTSRFFKWLKLKNPGMLRKIFYSELDSKKLFDPFERIKLTNLQACLGISQVKRNNQMIEKRRTHAAIFDSVFKNCEHIMPIAEKKDGFNNYLYYIIRIKNNTETFIDKAMKLGLYLMREEVWHCGQYEFSWPYLKEKYPIADKIKPFLVRLPNSSLLSDKEIHKITDMVLAP